MCADRHGRVPMVLAVGALSNDCSRLRLGSSRIEGFSGSPLPCSGSTPATGGVGALSCDAQSCRRFRQYFLPLASPSYDLLSKIPVHVPSVHFVTFGHFIRIA